LNCLNKGDKICLLEYVVYRVLRGLYTLNNTLSLTGQIPLLYLNSCSCVLCCVPQTPFEIKEDNFPFAVITIRCFPHAWLIRGFVTRLTPLVSLVVNEQLTVPGHMNSPPVLDWNYFSQLLVFCVMFCTSLFVFFSIFLRSLCRLSVFDLRLLITLWYNETFLSGNSSLLT